MKNIKLLLLVALLFLGHNFFYATDNSYHKKIYHPFNANNSEGITFKDENGNILFKKEVIRCYSFNEGYAVVQLKDFDRAILDENGNISECRFEMLGQKFSEGKNFAMFKDLTTGVIDTKGNLLFKFKVEFDECGALAATDFSNGKAYVKESKENGEIWYLIDDKGNRLKEFNNISYPRYFSCGLSNVQVREGSSWKSNYLDSNGNFISPVNFDDARDFEDGRALVKIGEESFYIGTDGRRLSE